MDPNNRNEEGKTAFHIAVERGDIDIVKLFLKYGADPNIRDNYRMTALDIAVEKEYFDIADLLRAYINPPDKNGYATLHLTSRKI